jgi:hypothetical protein
MINKKITILIIFLIGILLGIFIWQYFIVFRVVKTDPKNNTDKASYINPIFITFNRKIKIEDLSYEINPQTEFTTNLDPKNTAFILTPKDSLKPNADYTVIINFKDSKIYTLKFKTRDTDELPEGDSKKWEEAKEKLKNSVNWPVETKEYTIDYWPNKDAYLVTINWSPCEENKQKALKWFSGQGVDPNILKIVWIAAKDVPDDCIQ